MPEFAKRLSYMEQTAEVLRGLFGAMSDPSIISFGGGAPASDPADWLAVLRRCWPYLALALADSTPLPSLLWQKISGSRLAWLLLFLLLWVCVYFMATAASDPFLYFSF